MAFKWQLAPARLMLQPDQVHVFAANLQLPLEQLKECREILSNDEQLRAQRFKFIKHQNRFIAARGILRQILGGYLNITPSAVTFKYTAHGKPELARSFDEVLFFNISHTHDIALYAFTKVGEIGVDVEFVRPNFHAEALAARFFSKEESDELKKLSIEHRNFFFFKVWVRKEAFIKALGLGFSLALNKFSVTVAPEQPVKVLDIKDLGINIESWSMRDLEPIVDQVVAAIAFNGKAAQINCWRWN